MYREYGYVVKLTSGEEVKVTLNNDSNLKVKDMGQFGVYGNFTDKNPRVTILVHPIASASFSLEPNERVQLEGQIQTVGVESVKRII